jgi:hypothetical protein
MRGKPGMIAIRFFRIPSNSVPSGRSFSVQNIIHALQQQLHSVNSQLTNALTMGAAQTQTGGSSGEGDGNGSGGYSNVPMFDGTSPREIRTWTFLLRYKLAAQASRYPSAHAKLRYAIGRLEGAALNQVRSFVDENTGAINFGTLNDLLALLRQAYDDPDRAATAQKDVKALKQRYLQFSAYLAEFRRLMGDLDWDDQAQRYHLEEGLCEEMKDALEWRPKATTLNELINLCVEFDSRCAST